MKFVKEMTCKGIHIPAAALKLCGFEPESKLEIHTSENALVVLKGRMTAMELLQAAQHLQDLTVDLHVHLGKVCGPCDGCGEDGCPYEDMDGDDIDLPEYLREEAGIPEGAKLCAWVDEEEKTVTIGAADHDHDLRDVPPHVLEMFAATGMCVGELEERLILGDCVYGE